MAVWRGAGVGRIIYLGGLGDPQANLSPHLRSRQETGAALREAGVPVVPLGIRGGHFTAPILVRSRALATLLVAPRLIGLKRWGVSLLAVLGLVVIALWGPAAWWARALLAWAWLVSPLTFLPWVPWTLRMRVGAPMPAVELFPGAVGDEEGELRRALTKVQGAVQALVDR